MVSLSPVDMAESVVDFILDRHLFGYANLRPLNPLFIRSSMIMESFIRWGCSKVVPSCTIVFLLNFHVRVIQDGVMQSFRVV